MDSVFSKTEVFRRKENKEHSEIILAMIEIREAIEDGLARLDHTHLEAAMMLVGCKESFDSFLESRIRSEKVLGEVLAKVQGHPITMDLANSGKVPEKDEKPDAPPAEENKSSVTLKLGDLDKIPSDSGIE